VQITRPDDVGDKGIPNCKIYSKAQLRDIQKRKEESEKERKKAEKSSKEIEFSWQMAPNDFEMRLRQFAGFLAEGRKVEITIISKRRGREVEIGECEEFLEKIRGAAAEVGAKALGEPDGVLGKRILLKFQGDTAKK
jgi:translation initiation factor IF-3